MRTLDQILEIKGYEVLTARPDATVFEGLSLLAEHEVGALVVWMLPSQSASSANGTTHAR